MTITGGSTTGNGGGLYNDGGNVTLTKFTVSGNSAGNRAAACGRPGHGHADQLHRHRQHRRYTAGGGLAL